MRFEWTKAIQPDQWAVYRHAIETLRATETGFLLGGGFALASYIGRWRNTKDIDFYVLKEHRQVIVNALAKTGFQDYFSTLPYDRNWIYRSTRSGIIVDIIWAMANQRAQTDALWFERAPAAVVREEPLRVVPVEEFLWCKLYILQRDHCDWTDVLNVLYAMGHRIDWDHLLWRLEDDWPILKALLTLYGWLCPAQARKLPQSLRRKLRLPEPKQNRNPKRDRIRMLDSRGWFAALLPRNKPLEI